MKILKVFLFLSTVLKAIVVDNEIIAAVFRKREVLEENIRQISPQIQ